ncbi:hypothetical protein M758_UG009600 [Ceratodon purpureus]|nr:hypothetical protein M758_UG009600 [Ceratodon purpureus]
MYGTPETSRDTFSHFLEINSLKRPLRQYWDVVAENFVEDQAGNGMPHLPVTCSADCQCNAPSSRHLEQMKDPARSPSTSSLVCAQVH